ncbi:MAG: heat-inducible transcriptional repressor HrcA, partial [Oscillospiraceae bacterium]
MTERKERLLCAIVEKYIETGEPIGSKALVESLGMSVSSATVRNEMSDLVSMGYLEQPHTSAGRIPSSAGYRYYVDRLMNKYELSQNEKRVIETQLFKVSGEPQKILEQAGNILAEITNCAAVSTTPSDESAVIRRIELVPIGTKTAMVVILTSSGLLKSKVCRTEAEITLDMVESFYNMTMTHFIGKNVSNMNIAKIQTLAVSLGEKFFVMTPLLVTLCDLAEMTERTELLLEGQSNLLNHKEFESNAYEIMEFLRRSEPLNQIFTKNVEQKSDKFSPNVLIGKENLFRELQNSS